MSGGLFEKESPPKTMGLPTESDFPKYNPATLKLHCDDFETPIPFFLILASMTITVTERRLKFARGVN